MEQPNSIPSTSVNVCIVGCTGRVGKRLCALVESHPNLTLVGAIVRNDHEFVGCPLSLVVSETSKNSPIIISTLCELEMLPIKPDVIIDFSTPTSTIACLNEAAKLGIAVVIGTTGLSLHQEDIVKSTSLKIPIIHAMNFSLGINLLIEAAATVASALGEDFNIEIVEAHHNKKIDAPSGTALAIADSICESLGRSRSDLVHGRLGQPGQRKKNEIGVHAIRMGSVIGDHTIHFASEFERIELTHRAQNRDVFASGALRAGIWLVGRKPGLYGMKDVLFKDPK